MAAEVAFAPRAKVSKDEDDDQEVMYKELGDSEEDWEEEEEEGEGEADEGHTEPSGAAKVRINTAEPQIFVIDKFVTHSNGVTLMDDQQESEEEEDTKFDDGEYPALSVSEKDFDANNDDYVPNPPKTGVVDHFDEDESGDDMEESDVEETRKNVKEEQERENLIVKAVDSEEANEEEQTNELAETKCLTEEEVKKSLNNNLSLRIRSVDKVQGIQFDDEEVEEEVEEEEEEEEDDGPSIEQTRGREVKDEEKKEFEGDAVSMQVRRVSEDIVNVNSETEELSEPVISLFKPAVPQEESSSDQPETAVRQEELAADNEAEQPSQAQSSEAVSVLPEAQPEKNEAAEKQSERDHNGFEASKLNEVVRLDGRTSTESATGFAGDYSDSDDDDLRPPGCFAVCHVMVDTMKKLGIKQQ